MKKITIVITMMLILSSTINLFQLSKHRALTKNNRILIDSLKEENFNLRTTLDRYEITLDFLKEEDSASAILFDSILHTKTE